MIKAKLLILLLCFVMVFVSLLTACSSKEKQNSGKEKVSITGEELDNVIEDKWN